MFVDSWNDLDATTLNRNDNSASDAVRFKNQNLSKITMSHWSNKINNRI